MAGELHLSRAMWVVPRAGTWAQGPRGVWRPRGVLSDPAARFRPARLRRLFALQVECAVVRAGSRRAPSRPSAMSIADQPLRLASRRRPADAATRAGGERAAYTCRRA